MWRRTCFAVLVACLIVGVAAAPAWAQQHHRDRDRRISVTGDVVVDQGETINDPVIAIDGDAHIAGHVDDVYVGKGDATVTATGVVTGDVVVLRGDAVINGHVGGDVVVISGRATVREGASVRGDVTSGKEPKVARGTVRGEVKKLDLAGIFSGLLVGALVALWIATTVSLAVLGLLFLLFFPRAADRASAIARERKGASIGWGLLVTIVIPIAAFFAISTLVGIPLGLDVLGGLSFLAPLGYVVSALWVGRMMVKGPSAGARIGAFFAGFGILRLLALIPGLGFLIGFVAAVWGVGALTIAAWRAGHTPEEVPPGTTPPGEPAAATPASDDTVADTSASSDPAPRDDEVADAPSADASGDATAGDDASGDATEEKSKS